MVAALSALSASKVRGAESQAASAYFYVSLLSTSCFFWAWKFAPGLEVNKDMIETHLRNSLMLVTALNPFIGYDKGAYVGQPWTMPHVLFCSRLPSPFFNSSHSEVAKLAFKENITLREACCHRLKYLSEAEFDEYCDPAKMIGPSERFI